MSLWLPCGLLGFAGPIPYNCNCNSNSHCSAVKG
jgi:hypothetical protein